MKRFGLSGAKSIHRGVTWDAEYGKWKARITLPDGRRKYLGRFDDEIQAALAVEYTADAIYRERRPR